MDKRILELRSRAAQHVTRRHFLGAGAAGLGGSLFLQSLGLNAAGASQKLDFSRPAETPLAPLPPQFPARIKRVIYLHMAGAPSQLELFDYKPVLQQYDGQDTPQSFLEGKRFAFITGVPKLLGPQFPFHQAGESGAWISDRLPNLERHIDDLCFIKSMRTNQFNHAPAQLLTNTGHARLGHPSIGSWAAYGLGTVNQNLPGYIVLRSNGMPRGTKALWDSGFLPSVYQGVECRSSGDPVLFLSNPEDTTREERRRELDAISALNAQTREVFGDPETTTRISQYELAFRMQAEASDAFDIMQESEAVRERYASVPGEASFANNCLVARRLCERGVRFVQLFDFGWDHHGTGAGDSLTHNLPQLCKRVDQPIGALLDDLKASGLWDETLVIWAGEFGRTPMAENRDGNDTGFTGRDHNPGAFTIWMAGGGIKGGYTHGETDDMGYEIVRDPVDIADYHATILYLLGFDHHSLNYPYQGLNQKLTGVEQARVVSEILT